MTFEADGGWILVLPALLDTPLKVSSVNSNRRVLLHPAHVLTGFHATDSGSLKVSWSSSFQIIRCLLFFFHVLPLPEADRGFWGCFSVCQFWARVTSSVIRITYPNCCYFTVSKNVPLKIAYKYFTSLNKEELWTAFSLFNRRKDLLQPAKKPPTSAKPVCWTLCIELILSLYKLQSIRVCWQRDKPSPWGSM